MLKDKIPLRVYRALLDAGWTDADFEAASGKAIFTQFCEWEGLINWSEILWNAVTTLSEER